MSNKRTKKAASKPSTATKATTKASKPSKAKKATVSKDTSTKATYGALLAIDANPTSKADLTVTASKRTVSSILAGILLLGIKVSPVTYTKFAELTSAYRHGVATSKATADGDANNVIYIRHASAGLLGNDRHQWAVNSLDKVTDKELAQVVNALHVNASAVVTAAKASKAQWAIRFTTIGKASKQAKTA